MGIMDGKVCVITGGGGSLGMESARLLLQEGAKVMLVDNNQELLSKALGELGDYTEAVRCIRYATNQGLYRSDRRKVGKDRLSV